MRQAALAIDIGRASGAAPRWWADLTSRSSTPATIVAAASPSAVTVVAHRLRLPPGLAGEHGRRSSSSPSRTGTARLSVPALRKALGRRLQTMLPGSRVSEMRSRKEDDGWSVRVEADVPVCDLQDVHAAVLEAFRDDMLRVAASSLRGSTSS